jgi:hypothetical protein
MNHGIWPWVWGIPIGAVMGAGLVAIQELGDAGTPGHPHWREFHHLYWGFLLWTLTGFVPLSPLWFVMAGVSMALVADDAWQHIHQYALWHARGRDMAIDPETLYYSPLHVAAYWLLEKVGLYKPGG